MSQIVMPRPGERHAGNLTSDLPVLAGWSWPYVTLAGRQDGPRTTIIAGVHGCEYVSIYAAMRLARELDPQTFRGRLQIVPIVNLPSFWERTAFVSPIDGVNLNRVFPGNPSGTFTEALAHLIFSVCIAPSDVFIDLHGGDLVEELESFTGYAVDAAPDVVARSRAMAEAFDLTFCLGSLDPPGTVSGQSNRVAARHGVPSVLAEAGGIGQLTMPDVDRLVVGTRRALQVAGNLPGEPPPSTSRHLRWSGSVYAGQDGFWIGEARAGQEVRAGQRLGRLVTLLGEELETHEATADGVVVYRTTSAAVRRGGLLVAIAS
jgi:predicted deacylase